MFSGGGGEGGASLEAYLHDKILKVTQPYIQSCRLVSPMRERETLFTGTLVTSHLPQLSLCMLAASALVFWREKAWEVHTAVVWNVTETFPWGYLLLENCPSGSPCAKQLHRKFWGMFTPSATFILKHYWMPMGLVLWRGAEFATPKYATMGCWLF